MPNWTSNTIRAAGKERDLRAFLEAVKWQDEIFDFNRLIPMPTLLRHTASGSQVFDGKRFDNWFVENPDAAWNERIERPFTADEEAALKDIGYTNWYDWSVAHWGTKWNACRAEIVEECFEGGLVAIAFDTAWAPPLPVFYQMFALFPALSFTCSWQNECEYETYSTTRPAIDDDEAAS
jgi:hypothetical protein